MPEGDESAAARLRLALDLFDTGLSLARQRLRRRHPEWTAGQVEERLKLWLEQRPGAPAGDAEGRPIPWPQDGP